MEDAQTLEQKESAMARYLDGNGHVGDMHITTISKTHNQFNLTNNLMNLRMMQPKEAAVFPMEAPPQMNT